MFDLFKKKQSAPAVATVKPKTVLCIPGKWNDRSDLVTAVVQSNMGEFIFAGQILMNLKTHASFSIEVHKRNNRMKESFRFAGMVNRISEEFLNKIDEHNFVVYVIGDTGNLGDAKSIAEAGLAVLKSGGIGLKVESSGKAFTRDHWEKLVKDFSEPNLYEMFVLDSISDNRGTTYTCGMHNLGFKDTIVTGIEFQDAVNTLKSFGYYQLIDKPTVQNNQTFSVDRNAPVFNILDEANQPNKGDELFENPFGMWRLNKK